MPRKVPGIPTTAKPTTLEVPLYPRSAQLLLDLLEESRVPDGTPLYAVIDIDNLRNHLRAHLQRIAIGA